MKTSGVKLNLSSFNSTAKALEKNLGKKIIEQSAEKIKDQLKDESEKIKKLSDVPLVSISQKAKDLAQSLLAVTPKPPLIISNPPSAAVVEEKKTEDKGLKKPAVFFINGYNPLGLDLFYGGMKKLSESIPQSRFFEQDQVDSIIKEIKKRDKSEPVILVGHSLGGDSAVEIANKLNTLENGFRNIDLLVTLDSIGRDNDIIPQNVKKNLNFIGDQTAWLSDGPNIARHPDSTQVVNFLRSEAHTELDDSEDIQRTILQNIEKILEA